LHSAALHLPMAFVAHGDSFVVVAVLGLQQGQNLLVAPSNGQWVAGYVPAALRGYPFSLVPTDDGRKALAMDIESGLVGDALEGEALFENGQTTQQVQSLLNFLTQLDQDRGVTQRLCALLAAQGVIQPWPIKAVADDGDKQIAGLFRIDPVRLNQLDAQALHALQQTGALQMAYLQLISMEHLPTLGKLVQLHAQYAKDQQLMNGKAGEATDFQSDTLSFG
ncbi:MAG: SapC family protein, partial [Comamonas sp.]